MHFSIPDTQQFSSRSSGSSYTGFNIHINGSFHCCLRYKQLHSLHEQMRRAMTTYDLPIFPSKKLLPLTPSQLEQRRASLERYIQLVGQDPMFSKTDLLRVFLLNAQQESSFTDSRDTTLDIYLMNGYRIQVNCYTTDCSSRVLEKACQNIDLTKELTHYFALFLMRMENDGSVTLVRRLMDFEAPYISQRMLDDCRIVIRKSYWDAGYDQHLMNDSIALNLLYILAASDIEHGWTITSNDVREHLNNLQARSNKREYVDVAKSLPLYGSIKFSNAIVNYPTENVKAHIAIGNKELSIRTAIATSLLNGKNKQTTHETKFKVTRMRCWRVTTNYNNDEMSTASSTPTTIENDNRQFINSGDPSLVHSIELSFEYLMSKNCLKWITIASDEAMLMSVCLQSMVDELWNQKDGYDHLINNIQGQKYNTGQQPFYSYVRRDGPQHDRRISESSSTDTLSSMNDADVPLQLSTVQPIRTIRKRLKDKISTTVLFRNGKGSVHNEAFEGIGDDDL